MPQNIICKINDTPKIIVKFGEQGLMGPIGPTGPMGPGGTTDHALLTHLNYELAGHTGFQKQLIYSADFKCFEIE
jgi:hypothetical protein